MKVAVMDRAKLIQDSQTAARSESLGAGRRVLVITYHWPPDAAIGGVRPVKLVAQLKAHGWEPIILTVNPRYYQQTGTKLSDMGSDPITIRTSCLPNLPRLFVSVRRLFGKVVARFIGQSRTKSDSGGMAQDGPGLGRRGSLRQVLVSLLNTPDGHIGWLPMGLVQAVKAVRKHGVACIVSTGPPFTSHLVALCVQALSGVAWIADFRDPWFMLEGRLPEMASGASNWINQRMERAVIHRANLVVCVTPFMTQWYRERYPGLPSEHWETISNGFSVEEFLGLTGIPLAEKFTISYLGSIEYGRTPELVFQAVRELCLEGMMERQAVEIRLIGNCREACGRSMTELIASYELGDIVTMVPPVSRHEALKEMRRAHALLLLAPNQKLQTPGKAYEYIGAGRRILSITEPGWSTAEVVRSVGGAVVAPGDFKEMKRVLQAWYGEYQCGPNAQVKSLECRSQTEEFEWKQLGARYAQALNSIR